MPYDRVTLITSENQPYVSRRKGVDAAMDSCSAVCAKLGFIVITTSVVYCSVVVQYCLAWRRQRLSSLLQLFVMNRWLVAIQQRAQHLGALATIASDCHGVARCVCVTRVTQLTNTEKRFFVDETVFGINPLDNTAQGARSTKKASTSAVQRGDNNFGADNCGFSGERFLCCTSATQA
eukprot:14983-Heterococcus_DN1.PRE.1